MAFLATNEPRVINYGYPPCSGWYRLEANMTTISNDKKLMVRPFDGKAEYELMIDYFHGADRGFLQAMGVAPEKLPSKQDWLNAVLAEHDQADSKRLRFCLLWLCEDQPVGHSSINKIQFGVEAYIHLHLWNQNLRKSGMGTELFQKSIAYYSRRFALKKILCEPFAENPGPNKVLVKSGFRVIKSYRTIPGPINFEQMVNHYELAPIVLGSSRS